MARPPGASLLTQVSPVAWQRVNLHGHYEFRKGQEAIDLGRSDDRGVDGCTSRGVAPSRRIDIDHRCTPCQLAAASWLAGHIAQEQSAKLTM